MTFHRLNGEKLEVQTPIFMPCVTYGTVKGLSTEQLENLATQIPVYYTHLTLPTKA